MYKYVALLYTFKTIEVLFYLWIFALQCNTVQFKPWLSLLIRWNGSLLAFKKYIWKTKHKYEYLYWEYLNLVSFYLVSTKHKALLLYIINGPVATRSLGRYIARSLGRWGHRARSTSKLLVARSLDSIYGSYFEGRGWFIDVQSTLHIS